MKIKILTCLVLSCILISSISCGKEKKQSDDEVTITFWHSFVTSTIPALKELLQLFESEHPDIKIKAQYIPTGDALIQKLITAVQSKTAPDISWLHSDYMQDLVEAKAIYKMKYFIEGEDGISPQDLEDIYPALRTYASWKDTLYSMPMEATNLALIYNKEMFRNAGLDPEKPPRTWDELFQYSQKMTIDENGDGKYEQIGFFLPIFPASGPLSGWMVWQWMPYFWQAGGVMINEDQTQVLYNSPAGVEALSLWQDIFWSLGLSNYTTDYDVAFASGHLAMAMDGPWNLPRFNKMLKNLDWSIAPLPAGPKGRATIVGGEYLAIFKQSEHPESAWKFLKWVIQPRVQAFWSMKSGYLPNRRTVNDVPEFQKYLEDHSNFKVYVDQMEVARAQQSIDYYGLQITRHLAEAIEKATIGKMDPKTVLDEAAEKSNALLASAKNK